MFKEKLIFCHFLLVVFSPIYLLLLQALDIAACLAKCRYLWACIALYRHSALLYLIVCNWLIQAGAMYWTTE